MKRSVFLGLAMFIVGILTVYPKLPGVYLLRVTDKEGKEYERKVVRN